MDLSVIIPVYNTNISVLKRCVDSIKTNNSLDVEIVIVDDGSKENNSILYEKLVDERVLYYKQKNSGVSSARNLGIKKSRGKYITFVDSDDIVYADIFDKNYLDKNFDIILYDSKFIINEKEIISREFTCVSGKIDNISIIKDFLKNGSYHSPCFKLIRKQFLIENNLFFRIDMIQSEDAVFNLEMLEFEPTMFYIDKPMYGYYFDYSTSSSRWEKYPDKMFDNFLYLFKKKFLLIEKYCLDDTFTQSVSDSFVSNIFSLCLDKYKNRAILSNSRNILLNHKNSFKLSKKNKLKYNIITKGNILLISMISKFRSVYIKYLKENY